MNNQIIADVFGTMGAVCWSVQLIPQIVINYRRHNTTGLQPLMMLLWATAGVPLGVYNIVAELSIALRIQAQILSVLSLITWGQCYYYGSKWKKRKCIAYTSLIGALLGGVEVALVIALRVAKERSLHWPLVLMAVLSAGLLAAGVLSHYWDIYKHRTVRGISFLFVGIDAAGDLTSIISVLFQPSLDVLGIVIYSTELVLWIGVFACGGYFNLIPWLRRRMSGHREAGSDRSSERSQGEVASTSTLEVGDAIALHDLPSSTSVFRTPSGTDVVRRTQGRSGESEAMP